jgi:hypothetical protein
MVPSRPLNHSPEPSVRLRAGAGRLLWAPRWWRRAGQLARAARHPLCRRRATFAQVPAETRALEVVRSWRGRTPSRKASAGRTGGGLLADGTRRLARPRVRRDRDRSPVRGCIDGDAAGARRTLRPLGRPGAVSQRDPSRALHSSTRAGAAQPLRAPRSRTGDGMPGYHLAASRFRRLPARRA